MRAVPSHVGEMGDMDEPLRWMKAVFAFLEASFTAQILIQHNLFRAGKKLGKWRVW